jgi:hypothetical protein
MITHVATGLQAYQQNSFDTTQYAVLLMILVEFYDGQAMQLHSGVLVAPGD